MKHDCTWLIKEVYNDPYPGILIDFAKRYAEHMNGKWWTGLPDKPGAYECLMHFSDGSRGFKRNSFGFCGAWILSGAVLCWRPVPEKPMPGLYSAPLPYMYLGKDHPDEAMS